MIGKLLGQTIRVVTRPVDIVNAGMDKASGGTGSKRSRLDTPSPLSMFEEIRNTVADTAEELDEEDNT